MEQQLNAIFDYFDDEPIVVRRHSDAEFSVMAQLPGENSMLTMDGGGETLAEAVEQLYRKVCKHSNSN